MYIAIIFLLITNIDAQESAKYLESAIQDLKNMNSFQSQRKVDIPAPTQQPNRKYVPGLTLTKQEIAKLYESAVKKGNSIKLESDSGLPINAVVHELEDSRPKQYDGHSNEEHAEDSSAYYYYYYPLKSFMDELTSEYQQDELQASDTFKHEVTTKPTLHQYHTHTHKHNILIATKQSVDEPKKPKALEPLFMAISGFIGMAVMFVASVLILPKIGVLKSRGVKETTPEVTNVIKVIFQAIEGQDCADRFACELGKAAKAFNIHNNRFVKMIRRYAPSSFSKRLSNIDKYSNKKYKCAVIQCKKKNNPPKPLTAKQKNNAKS